MQVWKLCRHMDRANTIRAKLGDFENKPDCIVMRPGMKTRDYERFIKRLKRLENDAALELKKMFSASK